MNDIILFSDGACSGNPGPGGWGTIIVLPEGEVRELGGREASTTNNRMEMRGALEGLRALSTRPGRVNLYTDSTYLIQGITKWIWGWRKNGWKTAAGKDVVNVDLWKDLSAVLAQRGKESAVEWHYVRGHRDIPGNDRVDAIAVSFSQGRYIELFHGPLLKYPIAIHDIPDDTSLPERRPDSGQKKAPAYSYVSLVNGVALRHSSWPKCEARVKGRPGAKFKKATSAQDEIAIVRSWGVDPEKIRDDG